MKCLVATTKSTLVMSGADETATKRLIRQQMGHVACTHKCRCNNQGLVQHAKHCQQQLAVIQAKHKKMNRSSIKKNLKTELWSHPHSWTNSLSAGKHQLLRVELKFPGTYSEWTALAELSQASVNTRRCNTSNPHFVVKP